MQIRGISGMLINPVPNGEQAGDDWGQGWQEQLRLQGDLCHSMLTPAWPSCCRPCDCMPLLHMYFISRRFGLLIIAGGADACADKHTTCRNSFLTHSRILLLLLHCTLQTRRAPRS